MILQNVSWCDHSLDNKQCYYTRILKRQKISWKCYSKYKKTPFFSKENLILLDKALSIERKEVSLRSEIFVIIPTIIYIYIFDGERSSTAD